MTLIDRQVRQAQRRLWLNHWINRSFWCIGIAAVLFIAATLLQRLAGLPLPLGNVCLGLVALGIAAALIWSLAERESLDVAAARLDEAAGLRERLSSSYYCRQMGDDPFASAVIADAERVSTGISARQHIRLKLPRSFGAAMSAVVVALLTLLIPAGLFGEEKKSAIAQAGQIEQIRTTVKKRLQDVFAKVEENPALEDLKEQLEKLKDEPSAPLEKPDAIRHEALKRIDTLADAVKDKLNDPNYDKVRQFERMMRGLKVPNEAESPTRELTRSLAEGDYKEAQEQIKSLQEQLATLKHDEDKELAEKLSQQLEDLARQIEQLARNKQLEQKLQQAGIKPEDMKRMLETLSKQDLDQVRQALEKQGYNQQQIEQLARQLAQNQAVQSAARQLAQSMKQASQCNSPGQMAEAQAGLSQAGDQLSELEQLQTEMQQLDSTLSDLESAKNDLQPCSQCQGTGQKPGGGLCEGCDGTGQCPGGKNKGGGMGKNPGQGEGGVAEEQQTPVAFKIERQKVETRKGAIIGQFLIDGEQVKGQATQGLVEVVTASERDATDSINRDRIPRQYQKSVKSFFSTVQKALAEKQAPGRDANKEESAPEVSGDGGETSNSEKGDRGS